MTDLSFCLEPRVKVFLFNKIFRFKMLYCVVTDTGESQALACRVRGSVSGHHILTYPREKIINPCLPLVGKSDK